MDDITYKEIKKKCLVDSCDRDSRVRKFCDTHYRRWKKHGDPMGGNHTDRSLEEIFEEKYIPVTESGCWIWIGGTAVGYGKIGTENGQESAHRVSYKFYRGPIPDGLFVLHKCDVKSCVNPDHLFLGTQQDNISDMIKKGRGLKGEQCHSSKLTENDVINIRQSSASNSVLAKQYDMEPASIWGIRARITWKHL